VGTDLSTAALPSPSPRAASPVIAVWLSAILLASLAWCLHAIAPGADKSVALLVVIFVWFVAPGFLIARGIYGAQPGARVAALLVGAPWGFAASSLALLLMWVSGLRHPLLLAVAPLAAGAAAMPTRRLSGAVRPPAFSRADLAPLLLVLLLVPLVDGSPFARVGQPLPEGKAFRAYFNADTVWAMAEIAEVGKGDVPPNNPFLRGEPLHYYWLANLISAVEHRHLPHLQSEDVLLGNAVLLGLVFLGFMYAFVRHFVESPWASAVACIGVILCSSFEGAYALWAGGGSFEFVRNLNIDAVSRWMLQPQGMPIDGLHRLLWYQPHHALAWSLSLSGLLIVFGARSKGCFGINLLVGTVLGIALMLSPFPAIMVGLAVAVYLTVVLLRNRQWKALVMAGVAGALPGGLAVAAMTLLQYVDRAHGTVATVGNLNRVAAQSTVSTILLSFGPILIGAAIGLAFAAVRRRREILVVVLLMSISVFFYFFVDVPEHQHVYVAFRAGHLLFLSMTPLIGFALQEAWRSGLPGRTVGVLTFVLVMAVAAPTTAIDFYNTRDTSNRNEAPFGSWTYIVTSEELQALTWIKVHTAPDALVQIEPVCRGRETWFFIPAFAERRMVAGLPTSMVPLRPYEEASERVRELFQEKTSSGVLARAQALGINYIVVGRQEEAAYPALKAILDGAPGQFAPVFRNKTVTVYKVA
jgi:hypothetical protein